MPEDELEDIELIGLVEGTVDDLRSYVREKDLDDQQLEKLLQAEKSAKDRKTAERFLENQLNQEKDTQSEDAKDEAIEKIAGESVEENDEGSEEEIEEELEKEEGIDREELLKILGGTVDDMKDYVNEKDPSDHQLQEILHAEKIVNDRSTAVSFLKSYSKKEELKEDIKKTEHDFRELREDLDRIEAEVLDEDIDLSGVDIEDIEEDEASDEAEEVEEEPEEDEDTEEENEESDEMQEKLDIAEDLDRDLSREELENIPLEELKKIRDDKMEREELIEELGAEFDEEMLRKASTDDLRKLRKDLDTSKEEPEEDEDTEEEPETDKEDEEIKEEAQEDLEMLMGAVKEKDDKEEEKDRLQDLKDLRSNLRDRLSFGNDEEEESEKGIKQDDIIELLEEYENLGKYEAAIKTAHIMKGYLEYSEGIEREMTYKELTDEIEAETDEMETLMKFFRNMNKDQYTGNITADMDKIISVSKKVVKQRA